MRTATRVLGFAGACALVAGTSAAQNSNDANLNNNGDFYFTYSDPSVGSSTGTNPPNINGDLWWRANSGAGFMNDVDNALGSVMEVDGYFETLLDEDWSDSAEFLDRTHGPAVDLGTGLQPLFFSAGLTTEVLVSLGPSGFFSPCTLYPSLCSPSGSTCAAPGTAWGWIVDIGLSATPGTGVILPADGTAASDMATTYFLQGGMTTLGGACGTGTNETSDIHSTDETQADPTGGGFNPSGGFQVAGGGAIQEGIISMGESHETYRGNIVNMVADTGSGLGVEVGDNAGGAMNGRNLSVGSGLATLGVELRDFAGAAGANVGIAGASTIPLANPGIPALGGWLGVLPNGVFTATSSIWQGTVTPVVPVFVTEGTMNGAQLPLPVTISGATLFTQGATFSLVTFTANSTNVVRTRLLP
jgi:hypothetical protein